MDYVEMISGVVGGLCIFLLGMKNMSEGMQAVAGTKLRKMVAAVTDNRFVACGTGAAVTSLIQSSSVTTVMVVGMVNAGVMTLAQAIGVILGADIGTTITAWIVSMNVTQFGLPLLGVAGFFFLFTKNERVRYSAMMIMGLGMVFFGLTLMKHGLAPLRTDEGFIALFSKFTPSNHFGVIKCVLVGALVTAIVQSSSATVAITIMLARGGLIEYDAAVALVLGQNIGTTITAYLACLGASTLAKRAAYAHICIKMLSVIIMVPFFFMYMKLLDRILPEGMDIAKMIAFAHTLFNIMLVCLFLPFVTPLAVLMQKIAPDKPHKEPPRLTFLDVRLLDTPAFGIQQSSDELLRMGENVTKMLDWVKKVIISENEDRDYDLENKIFHREEVMDIMQKEVMEFLGHLLSGSVPHEVMVEARKQLRVADEYESISDYLVSIVKLRLKMHDYNMKITDEGKKHLLTLHDHVVEYVALINEAVKVNDAGVLSKAHIQGDTITHMMKDYRHAHISRVETKKSSPLTCLVFVDILQSYRKIKDHALNIAEAVAGEK